MVLALAAPAFAQNERGPVSPDMIVIDGKTSRRTHARRKSRGRRIWSPPQRRERLGFRQEAVDHTSNEVVAIRRLLQRLAAGASAQIKAAADQRPDM
jgi:hypothetical protein